MELKSDLLSNIPENKRRKLVHYLRLVEKWMLGSGLVSFDIQDLLHEVILDSLAPYFLGFDPFDLEGLYAVDIGSGAGIPGIPLSILMDSWEFHLVESNGKKAGFLSFVSRELGLSNVVVEKKRVEDLAREKREIFDLAFERAVGSTPVMVEYAAPLLKVGGSLFIYGGKKNTESLNRGKDLLGRLGFLRFDTKWYELLGKRRCIISLKKEKNTPSLFPRRTGVAVRRPLW